ncbi:MAG: tRNA lysidine(34) synthetase TilS, partial [Clostridia bacterium]|nr:tRNA lysidine(34) synthetase TilS [Clostridia bacterium]
IVMFDEFMTDYLNSFDKLALAISGGRDSMALLHWFCLNFSKDRFFVITVHHNLRGDEGRRDRDFVIDYCKSRGVECRVYEEDIPTFCKAGGYTVEQGARIRRRQIFADVVASGQAQRVITAHHAQDQVESVLMHIFRGSGIKGLRGMSLDDKVLIRPMLKVSREQVEDYIRANAIPYVDDSSNDSGDYTRNKLRLQILPLIREAYGGADNNILRLSERAAEICEFLDERSGNFTVKQDEAYIPLEVLQGERIIATNTVINAVDRVATRVDLTQKHIDAILSLKDKPTGASVSLPFALTAHRDSEHVVLAKLQERKYSGLIDGYGDYDLGEEILRISQEQIDKLRCDLDKLCGCEIRNRRAGDVFKRYKGATKSLGDYLTDIKAPRRIRDNIVVLAKENIVYALPQYEISDAVKIDEDTKRVAYISLINKNN